MEIRLCIGSLWILLIGTFADARQLPSAQVGKQRDGSFIVATGQRIEGDGIAFEGRPIDLALHPSGAMLAVLNKGEVFLCSPTGVMAGSGVSLGHKITAGFRGIVWSPDGTKLYCSTEKGHVQALFCDGRKVWLGARIAIAPAADGNPVPGGMAITKDGQRLYVAAVNRNAVVEIDLASNKVVREFAVQNLPFEARLTDDEKTLVVSNWGGRIPGPNDKKGMSVATPVVIDNRGVTASGSASIVDLETGKTTHVEVGLHPTSIAIVGDEAFVANAMSDSISVLDLGKRLVKRTIPIRWGDLRIVGAMPNALAANGKYLYACNGGDNAVCEIDIKTGKTRGFRHAGFFPTAIQLSHDGKWAYVVNTKGNGSVRNTNLGKKGNAHDFEGTVSVVDLTKDIETTTPIVANNNSWTRPVGKSKLKVYNGAIKHVLYIIKENRTYDDVYGDMPIGNGDPNLCSLGEKVMPNHRKIAREFTLFDNGYVSGTNSAEGHAWSTQAIANEYLEHFYVGYSRTYPDDGDDPMALSTGGAIWDAALKRNLSIRIWGEFCDEKMAQIEPSPVDWFEVWEDRLKGTNKFKCTAFTYIPSIKPFICPNYLYWPLWQSDQHRADIFIREYEQFSKDDKVPSLMIMSLPSDHGEGTNPRYPTPRAMMANNDLALGRIVEAVSKSPQWKETCIFVIEDDAQSGPDHVDGHRTVFTAISPYTKRKYVDSTRYTTVNMIRSIEMMLGMAPMNKFDLLAYPMENCFVDEPDPTGFTHVPNNVPLDERNPSGTAMTADEKFWLKKTMELDWSKLDAADPYWLNRINWFSIYKGSRPYPARPGEMPGVKVDDDD